MARLVTRSYAAACAAQLAAAGIHPVLARVYAARGIERPQQLEAKLARMLPLQPFMRLQEAAAMLADAIERRQRLLIVADYDCDGATACAIGVRALRAMGATIDYLVPNRFEYGYGLTPEIVRLAAARAPEVLITVDNGMSSVEGVAEANRLGMRVVITDHHLPGPVLPDAACIVNPNQAACEFPSKHLAGVGVMFYVLSALRAQLRARGHFAQGVEPNLGELLDLVALGTVADVVRLDDNNRILVEQGLLRIRAGRACAGVRALYRVAGRDPRRASTFDLGYALGPRVNAAGRLADMSLGIQALLADDDDQALALASRLDELNRERKDIETSMQDAALAALDRVDASDSYSLCVYDPSWHQGVIGILASRLKDKFHRPVVAFAKGNAGELKGSGRASAGLHLRDALDRLDKQAPGLLLKFGGHAAAAGVTIAESGLQAFADGFEALARTLLTQADLDRVVETDGALACADLTLDLAHRLAGQAWGHGFPEPLFSDAFRVLDQRVVGERHSRLLLEKDGQRFEAMAFSYVEPLPERIHAAYRLQVNDYQGLESLQLTLQHFEAA